MGAVIVLFVIGFILSVIHFFFGLLLESIRARAFTTFSLKKWTVVMVTTGVGSFLIFGYGVGMQLCSGRTDLASCIEAVIEVTLKMGIVIFPMIILFGMIGVILGRRLALHIKPTQQKLKKKKR